MTADSERCFDFLLSLGLSESRCDRTELVLAKGGWRRESEFVWERGRVSEDCAFPGPSLIDGGSEVEFMSRKE